MSERDEQADGADEAASAGGEGPGAEEVRRAEREARLAALLRVDIDQRPGPMPLPAEPAPIDAVPTDAVRSDEVPADEVPAEPVRSAPVLSGPSVPETIGEPPVELAPSRPRRRLTTGAVVAAVVLVVLFATGGTLVWAGATLIRTSTEGDLVAPVRDPGEPGFEALIDGTPTMLVVHDVDGAVDSLTVLSLPDPSEGGGGVVYVPTRVVVEIPILGRTVLEAGYDLGSAAVQGDAVGDLLVASIGEVAVVDDERWAGLVEPVAPIRLTNPDQIEVEGEVRFESGPIELEPEDVGAYLRARVEGESDLARLFRQETFWRAWFDAVAEDGGADAVPGELESGIGRFVRSLATGTTEHDLLPVVQSTSDEFGDEPTFLPDQDAIDALVARLVPFPSSPRPGVRPRVRLLSGTEDTDEAIEVAPLLPPVGVEVVLVGNASDLGATETTIAYVEPEQRDVAEEIAEVLGFGRVLQDPRPSDVADITVTLGADHD